MEFGRPVIVSGCLNPYGQSHRNSSAIDDRNFKIYVRGLYRLIRRLEPTGETNIQRNLVQLFMVGTIVIGCGGTLMVLDATVS